jgi:hypothetical protein
MSLARTSRKRGEETEAADAAEEEVSMMRNAKQKLKRERKLLRWENCKSNFQRSRGRETNTDKLPKKILL